MQEEAFIRSSMRRVPFMLLRGGTSRGPYFLAEDLPVSMEGRSKVLLQVMGSPDPVGIQANGLGGGGVSILSKAAIVAAADPQLVEQKGVDVCYTFAQVGTREPTVKWKANCGNIMSGVGPFAIMRNLVTVTQEDIKLGHKDVRIFNTNSLTRATVKVPLNSIPNIAVTDPINFFQCGEEASNAQSGIPVELSFLDVLGPLSGKVFPTGKRTDVIQGVRCTCLDSANPVVLIHGQDISDSLAGERSSSGRMFSEIEAEFVARLAKRYYGDNLVSTDLVHDRVQHLLESFAAISYENPEVLNNDSIFLAKLEHVRQEASNMMGMGDAKGKNLPKVCVLSPPVNPLHSISSRYFVPDRCHSAHAVTGAIAIAVATTFEGTVADDINVFQSGAHRRVVVEHPSGILTIQMTLDLSGSPVGKTTGEKVNGRVLEAKIRRSTRPILDGNVFVPENLFTEAPS